METVAVERAQGVGAGAEARAEAEARAGAGAGAEAEARAAPGARAGAEAGVEVAAGAEAEALGEIGCAVSVHLAAAVAQFVAAAALLAAVNVVATGILYARTAGDLATLLGIVHLLLPAITVIFQGTLQQNALLKLFAGTARSLDTLLLSARTRPYATPAARQGIWHAIALPQDLTPSYATTVSSQATLLLTAPMTAPATTAASPVT